MSQSADIDTADSKCTALVWHPHQLHPAMT